MRNIADYAKYLAKELLGITLLVRIINDKRVDCRACYSKLDRQVTFNVRHLGAKWFNQVTVDVDGLIIHELGHELASNHYSEDYYRALCKLGAKLKALALEKPQELRRFLLEPAAAEMP